MAPFAWPISVCLLLLILGLVVLLQHRESIGRLIGRTTSIGKGGLTTAEVTALATQTDTKSVARPSAAEELLRSFDNQLLVEQEKLITDFLADKEIFDTAERERVLVRYLASSYIVTRFEAIYAGIFGSQVQALQSLNQNPGVGLSTELMQGWYTVGMVGYPHIYGEDGTGYAFGQWLGYLYRWNLVTMVGTIAHITVAGQEFLRYLVSSSYSADKAG